MRTTRWINRAEAIVEAQRCLGCHEAPCRQACPAGVDIPGFIRRLREENIQGAGALIYEACPLGNTCGLACPTDTLCEGACVLKDLGQTPVRIGSLQAFACNQYEDSEEAVESMHPMHAAVVGAGPSGLGCAVQLARLGHKVQVFDDSDRPSGLVDRVIPAYRLPAEVIETDFKRLEPSGIKFHLKHNIDASRVNSLKTKFDLIFIGAGMGSVNAFTPPGHDLPGVCSAMDFLAQARDYAREKGTRPTIGKNVAVIGGGNVALDAAVTAIKLGADRVIVLYRRTKEQMPGWESEYLEAAALGVEFRWLSVVEEVLENAGEVCGVRVGSMRLTEPGPDGRRKVVPDGNVPVYTLPCDQIIHALGQILNPSLADAFGLETNLKGSLQVNPYNWQTSDPQIFAAGECTSGGSTIINSLSQGMQAARAMHTSWLEKVGKS